MESFTIQRKNPKSIIAEGGELFEGLTFDPISKRLWWVDILGNVLSRADLANENIENGFLKFERPSATMLQGNELVLAANQNLYWINLDSFETTRKIKIPTKNSKLCTNEAKIDPEGNIWVGMMDRDGKTSGEIWVLTSDFEFSLFASGIGIPNTFLWDLQRDRFYFADSLTSKLFVQKISISARGLTPRVHFEAIDRHHGTPDGSELLTETGIILNCRWGAGAIFEILPNGKLSNIFEIPWNLPTDIVRVSDETYVVSSAREMSLEAGSEKSGAIFSVELS